MSEPDQEQPAAAAPASSADGSKISKQQERHRQRMQRRRRKQAQVKKEKKKQSEYGRVEDGEQSQNHQNHHQQQQKQTPSGNTNIQSHNNVIKKRKPKRKRKDNDNDNSNQKDVSDEQQSRKQQQNNRPSPSRQESEAVILHWPCGDPNRSPYIPKEQEEAMVEILFEHNGKKERNMLKSKPPHVVDKFIRNMRRVAPSMTISAMCSLRRHHIKLHHPNKTMPQCGLGSIENINQSARMFELSISQFLKAQNIPFRTEKQLKKQQSKEHGRVVATPDFTFPNEVLLQVGNNANNAIPVHWMEVKMYYGASTIPHGGAGAVGTVLNTAQKYVSHFGPGCMVFMMGCGDGLACDLLEKGVTCLTVDDAAAVASGQINLKPVHDHQRTWCANERGEILP